MRIIVLIWLSIFVSTTILAQTKKTQFSMRFTEIHGEHFGNLKVKDAANNWVAAPQYSVGASVNVGKEFLGSILEYNYRMVNLTGLNLPNVKKVGIHELYLGIRYFPMRPTFMIGNSAVRLTLGAEGGLDFEPNWRFLLFSGIAISSIQNVSGITLNFVYRPGSFSQSGYLLTPAWTARLGLVLGPSAN